MPAKINRQTLQALHAHPLLGKAIQRGQRIQLTAAPQTTITLPNDKYVFARFPELLVLLPYHPRVCGFSHLVNNAAMAVRLPTKIHAANATKPGVSNVVFKIKPHGTDASQPLSYSHKAKAAVTQIPLQQQLQQQLHKQSQVKRSVGG